MAASGPRRWTGSGIPRPGRLGLFINPLVDNGVNQR